MYRGGKGWRNGESQAVKKRGVLNLTRLHSIYAPSLPLITAKDIEMTSNRLLVLGQCGYDEAGRLCMLVGRTFNNNILYYPNEQIRIYTPQRIPADFSVVWATVGANEVRLTLKPPLCCLDETDETTYNEEWIGNAETLTKCIIFAKSQNYSNIIVVDGLFGSGSQGNFYKVLSDGTIIGHSLIKRWLRSALNPQDFVKERECLHDA